MEGESTIKKRRAKTAKDQENSMINLAMERAEELLHSPKPPTQILLHFLKLATEQTMLQREKLRNETTLLKAKSDSIKAANNSEEIARAAIEAMTTYAIPDEEYYDEEEL